MVSRISRSQDFIGISGFLWDFKISVRFKDFKITLKFHDFTYQDFMRFLLDFIKFYEAIIKFHEISQNLRNLGPSRNIMYIAG